MDFIGDVELFKLRIRLPTRMSFTYSFETTELYA